MDDWYDFSEYERGGAPRLTPHGRVIFVRGYFLTGRTQSDDLIRALTERAPVIIFALDADGKVTFSEGQGLKELGLEKDRTLGRSVFDLYKAYPEVSNPLAKGLAGEELHWSVEVRDTTFEVVVTPLTGGGLVGVARDVTDQLRAENALKASEAKFAAAFRHSLDSVLLTAVPNGEILEINKGFTLITGYERQQALGKTTLELGIWADPAQRDEMFASLREQGKLEGQEAAIRNASGQIRECRLWGELLEVEGAPVLLTVVRDVTEQRAAERERRDFITELEAKNRELEQFSLTVAHDLKAPLISIQGLIEVAAEDLGSGELSAVDESLRRIDSAARRMSDLLSSVLALSRAGRVFDRVERVDLREIVEEALEQAVAVSQEKLSIVISEALGTAIGDRIRLLQVYQNLISNSVKFMGEQERPLIEIGVRPAGPEKVYFVRDNGSGIEPDDLGQIFDLYYRRRHRSVEGSGVGLALVHRIIEAHNGKVWAESSGPGTGSILCFTLGLSDIEPRSS